jgi:hypothetical protein
MKATNKLKLLWARRLLRAKYFVVMTDRGSAISFESADPKSLTDAVGIASQRAELQSFYQSISSLIIEHDKAIKKLTGVGNADKPKQNKKSTTTKQGNTKGKKN